MAKKPALNSPVPLDSLPVGVIEAMVAVFAAEMAIVKQIDPDTYVVQLTDQICQKAGESIWGAQVAEAQVVPISRRG